MPRFLQSLHGRLTALYLALLLVAVGACLGLASWQVERYVREVEQRVNRPVARALARELAPSLRRGLDTPATREAVRHAQALHPALDIYFLDAEGGVVREFKQQGAPARHRVALAPIRTFLADSTRLPLFGDDPAEPEGTEVFSATPVTYGAGQQGYLYAILRGMPHTSAAARVQESYVLRMLAVAILIAVVLAGLGGAALFGVLTRRFRTLTGTVERFRAGDFAARAPEGRGDEIGRLGRTFNEMAERTRAHLDALHEADDARRALAENVAHDLRGSLTSTRDAAERLLDDDSTASRDTQRAAARSILDDVGRLTALTDQLALLSDLDAQRLTPLAEPLSAADLAQDVALRFQPEASRLGITLTPLFDRPLPPVYADIALVERVLANLIENALKHTPAGGTVRVGGQAEGDRVRLVVSDTGHGIAPDDLPLVTRRFYRTVESRARGTTGSGLGLAIARELVELHGGALEIESALGAGTTVAFTLPTQAPAPGGPVGLSTP